jgi:hypothetical protein
MAKKEYGHTPMLRHAICGCLLVLLGRNVFALTPDSLRSFRFVEVKRVKEIDGLPPELRIVFDLMCNEKFLTVIRHDETDGKTGKVTIAVGALVEENLLSGCAGESKEMEVSAGKTFSGREFLGRVLNLAKCV